MTAGVSMIGRDITMTVGGSTLLGVVEKSISRTNELIETTDDAAAGWQQFDAKAGKKGLDLSVSGIVKSTELIRTWYETSQAVACVITYDDNNTTPSTETFDAVIESLETGMPGNEGSTYSLTLKSSGTPVFVAGT